MNAVAKANSHAAVTATSYIADQGCVCIAAGDFDLALPPSEAVERNRGND
jgi:hypothetical protein